MSGEEGMRTACHGCRGMERAFDGDGNVRVVHSVGHGIIVREVAPGRLVPKQCPVCDGSGWLTGFQPPM